MEQLEESLKLYFKIQEDKLPLVLELFELLSLNKGEEILSAGQFCKNMVFIKSGILRIYALNDGKEVTQWIASEGYFMADLNSRVYID